MRIVDDVRDHPVDRIWIYLTETEARALVGTLQDRLNEAEPDTDWHAHLESSEDSEVGVTVAIYNPKDLPRDEKISAFLRDGTW